MKITITTAAVGPNVFTLGDDSVRVITTTGFGFGAGGAIREGFLNKQRRVVQRTPLMRAPYQLVIPRYNLENRIQFLVQRTFSSPVNCVKFIAEHPDDTPATGELAITHSELDGFISRFLPNAIVESVECVKHNGAYCEFQYVLSGNGPWQTLP